MRYVTRVDLNTRLESLDKENIEKYEVLSIVLHRLLAHLSSKIRNINDNYFFELNDLVLLCHLAILCS